MFNQSKTIRVMMLSAAAAAMMSMAAAAANSYDARSENMDQVLLFPGDVLFGAGNIILGETGEQAAIGPEGEWYNNDSRVYRVNIDHDNQVTVLMPFGSTVTVEDGISRSEDLIEDTHYYDHEGNWLSEEYFVVEEEETPEKDVASYPEWMTVKIQAREASDGEVFDHWESSDEVILEEPYSPETSFVMGSGNVSLRAVFTQAPEGGIPEEQIPDEELPEDGEMIDAPQDDIVYDDEYVTGEETEPLQIEEGWSGEEDSVFDISDAGPGSNSIFDGMDPDAIAQDAQDTLDQYAQEAAREQNEEAAGAENVVVSEMQAMQEAQPEEEMAEQIPQQEMQMPEQQAAPVPEEQAPEIPAQEHSVTVDGGSVMVDGSDEQISQWAYPQAEYVTVNTPEREGAVFDHWESDQEDVVFLGNEGERLNWFMMPDHDVTVRAVWSDNAPEEPADNPIRIQTEHVYIYGDVTVSDANEISAKQGGLVNLQADELEDKDFDHWVITSVSDNTEVAAEDAYSSVTSFAMPEDGVNISAIYRDKPVETHTVSIRHGEGAGTYSPGDTVIIKAQTALEGERFKEWNVSAGNVTLTDKGAEQTSFVMGSEDVSINAVYEYIEYNLKVTSGSGSGTYRKGENVPLTAQWPADGKEFDTWLVNSSNAQVADASRFSTSIVMPADHVSVQALYKDGPSVNDNLISGITEGTSFMRGTTITFGAAGAGMENADPNPGDFRWRPSGYRIGSASGSWSDTKTTASMAINAVGNYTLYVDYIKDVYNGTSWENNGVTDTRSVSFTVTAPEAVETGDDTPVLPFVIAAGASLAVIIAIIILLLRRKR